MAFLTGRSGAGKSTLLKLIMLTERPDQGQLVVGARNILRLSAKQIPFIAAGSGWCFRIISYFTIAVCLTT